MKYKRKIKLIEAIQWLDTLDNIQDISTFLDQKLAIDYSNKDKPILRIEGYITNHDKITYRVNLGDYVVKDNGLVFSCSKTYFDSIYEEDKKLSNQEYKQNRDRMGRIKKNAAARKSFDFNLLTPSEVYYDTTEDYKWKLVGNVGNVNIEDIEITDTDNDTI